MASTVARQIPPQLVGGEGQDRRHPAGERLGDVVHRALRRTTTVRIGRHRVQAVLGHVQVQRAQVHAAEVQQQLHDLGHVVVVIRRLDLLLQLPGAVHDPAVQRDHLVERAQVLGRIETVQVAQQEAGGVAQATVGVGGALEDFLRQRHLVAVVGRGNPQAQDVRAQLVHDFLRLDTVAQRLGHLAAVLVHGETVGEALLVRRALVDGHAGQQRGLEPAAMLVGTFQVQVGRLAEATRGQHCFMGHAGIEPDVEDVGDLLVVGRFSAQQFSRIQRVPHVDAFGFNAVGHLLHQLHRTRVDLACLAVGEQCDRHAPGALARDRPVRAAVDHALDARLAPAREPADGVDGGQRIVAQVGLVHRNEPLRGGAEHHRRLVPPAVRVAVADLDEGQQCAAVTQHLHDRLLRLPQVLASQHHVAGRRGRFQVDATAVDRGDLTGVVLVQQAVLLADHVVFLAVAGGGVHRTGTVLVGYVFAVEHEDLALRVERMDQQLVFQR
ncbi:hypothetical protein D3C73_877060 [compost metagenome]